jgi:hypothetical protein
MVSDGEDSVYIYLTVHVDPVPDPPRIVEVFEPLNNSVLIPGHPVTLSADIEDPDLPGDVLTIRWTSDRDGIVSYNSANRFDSFAYLSPGIHRLTLTVNDSTNGTDEVSVIVAVSIWGFKEMMWDFTLDMTASYIDTEGLDLITTIRNDATSTLTFRCILNLTGTNVSEIFERVLVLAGGTDGTVVFKDRSVLREGGSYELKFTIRAETTNGTFAGSRSETHTFIAERHRTEEGGQEWLLQSISIAALFIIAALGTIIMIMVRKNNKRKREIGRDRR